MELAWVKACGRNFALTSRTQPNVRFLPRSGTPMACYTMVVVACGEKSFKSVQIYQIFQAIIYYLSQLFSTQRRRGAEVLEIMRGREGIDIDALA